MLLALNSAVVSVFVCVCVNERKSIKYKGESYILHSRNFTDTTNISTAKNSVECASYALFIKSWELQNKRKNSQICKHLNGTPNDWMSIIWKVLNIFSLSSYHEHSLSQFIYLCLFYITFYSYIGLDRNGLEWIVLYLLTI